MHGPKTKDADMDLDLGRVAQVHQEGLVEVETKAHRSKKELQHTSFSSPKATWEFDWEGLNRFDQEGIRVKVEHESAPHKEGNAANVAHEKFIIEAVRKQLSLRRKVMLDG